MMAFFLRILIVNSIILTNGIMIFEDNMETLMNWFGVNAQIGNFPNSCFGSNICIRINAPGSLTFNGTLPDTINYTDIEFIIYANNSAPGNPEPTFTYHLSSSDTPFSKTKALRAADPLLVMGPKNIRTQIIELNFAVPGSGYDVFVDTFTITAETLSYIFMYINYENTSIYIHINIELRPFNVTNNKPKQYTIRNANITSQYTTNTGNIRAFSNATKKSINNTN